MIRENDDLVPQSLFPLGEEISFLRTLGDGNAPFKGLKV